MATKNGAAGPSKRQSSAKRTATSFWASAVPESSTARKNANTRMAKPPGFGSGEDTIGPMRTGGQGFIGMPLARKEDARLLTGQGSYTSDLALAGAASAFFVRSPHAHARIRGVDAAHAATMPGVLAILTGADAIADGLQPIPLRPISVNPHEVPLQSR